MRKLQFLLATILLLTVLIGCGSSVEEGDGPTDVPPTTDPSGYPAPVTRDAYPGPEAGDADRILIALEKPLQAGDTEIRGQGPAGVQVYLLNMTTMGEDLGSVTVGADGTFVLTVNPLPEGVRIGLSADLEAAGMTEDQVRPADGAISIPRVGYVFDSFVIPQQ